MTNFAIHFSYPWLFFLLIPGLFLAFFPYFRLEKKYRRTRNRIISVVLHTIVVVLCVTALVGVNFTYNVPTRENEVLLLVDVSDSGENGTEERDDFVKSVIDNSTSRFKIGVVTFGYTQVYAADFSTDKDKVYRQYIGADLPDTSATDIASALLYAKDLFEKPESGKILLISDGIETDSQATSVIKSLTASGIKVDTCCIQSTYGNDVLISGVELPDYNVVAGETFNLTVTLQSSFEGRAYLTLHDEDNDGSIHTDLVEEVDLTVGVQTVALSHAFDYPGLHRMSVSLECGEDTVTRNNVYYSYMYLELFNNVLILERFKGESEPIETLLTNEQYTVTVANILDAELVPSTVDELRAYDEVILVNIANDDMPLGFDNILYSYVNDFGGGLLAVGGSEENDGDTAHAYNRVDMYNTLYQSLLPVQAIDYSPPLAVMIIIDHSGSMGTMTASGLTKLELAKSGAKSCLYALTERDYCGIMTLEDSYSSEIYLTPLTQRSKIEAAIDAIPDQAGGGTIFTGAIEQAAFTLKAANVERRHIILISDGEPGDSFNQYSKAIETAYAAGITCSIVCIDTNISANRRAEMTKAAEECGGGKFYEVAISNLSDTMRSDLMRDSIKEVDLTPFTPVITSRTSVVNGIRQEDVPLLNGYYGTKLKEGAEAVLSGEFIPIYASWKFGEGSVGSLLTSVEWAENYFADDTGRHLILNMVKSLFPMTSIRPQEIDVAISEDNYTTQLSIYTDLESTQTIEVTLKGPEVNGISETQTVTRSASENYSRISLTINTAGVHTITVRKLNADGSAASTFTTYKSFSYSEEYNTFADPEVGVELLETLAERGNGVVVEHPLDVYEDYVETVAKSYDPRLPIIITAIILFLLDVAVRKFKFKWIHEIIRERKEKKLANQPKN